MSPKCQEVWRKNMFFFGYLDTWIPKICQVSKKNGIQKYPRVSMTTPQRTFPSNFVKLVSKILYLFLAEKMVVCCFVCFVCCNFVRFWLTFFLIEALIELRKMLLRKKLYHAQPLRYPDSADLPDLQRCN